MLPRFCVVLLCLFALGDVAYHSDDVASIKLTYFMRFPQGISNCPSVGGYLPTTRRLNCGALHVPCKYGLVEHGIDIENAQSQKFLTTIAKIRQPFINIEKPPVLIKDFNCVIRAIYQCRNSLSASPPACARKYHARRTQNTCFPF